MKIIGESKEEILFNKENKPNKLFNFSSSLFPNISLPMPLSSSYFPSRLNANNEQSSFYSAHPYQSYRNKISYSFCGHLSQKEYLEELEEKRKIEEDSVKHLLSLDSTLKSISELIASPMLNPIYFGVLFLFII
jgi:hypothetical protein